MGASRIVTGNGQPWDLLVVGGGTAGIVGAKTAARLGARVALVERHRTGGDCLWTGCVPSKALLAAAGRAAEMRSGRRFGIGVDDVAVHFETVMDHVRGSIESIAPVDSVEALEAAGVRVISGHALFTGPTTISVEGSPAHARRILLATGAAPAMPPIPGLSSTNAYTSEDIWELASLPRRMVVLGGGSIGCELGQAFARLGASVTIVEALPSILPREDPDAATLVRQALAYDGVELLEGHSAVNVAGDRSSGTVTVQSSETTREIGYDLLLVAVGRRPRTSDLGLDMAGIATDPRGFVVVDRHLRTTNPRVWAAGDLTPHPQFTHVAGVHGSLAASNAVLGLRRSISPAAIPRVTFTDPEVAAVGAPTWNSSETSATSDVRFVTRQHSETDRAIVEGRTDGFARLATDSKGRIVGATIVGPRAGESISEVTLAVKLGLTTRALAATVHPYPTYADAAWNAAIADVQERLARPTTQRWLGRLVRARRVLGTRSAMGSASSNHDVNEHGSVVTEAPASGADASPPKSSAPR